MALNTTPATFTASEVVTSTKMNTEIRDALTGIQAAWTAYTPTWTAVTTNPTLGNGTLAGAYTRFGKTVFFSIVLTIGSTTTLGSGIYGFTLPVTSRLGNNLPIGPARLPGSLVRHGILASTTEVRYYTEAGVAVTHAVPVAWATGNQMYISGSYEAA